MLKIIVCGKSGKMANAIRAILQQDEQVVVVNACLLNVHDKLEFDIAIDFTAPMQTIAHLNQCVALQRPIVIGTTGFNATQLAQIQQASLSIPIILAPNMSVGMNLLYTLLEIAAKTIDNAWNVSITETHNQNKKDSPSGTAIQLRKIMAASLAGQDNNRKIEINSFRIGDIVGEHTITFSRYGEVLQFTHTATERKSFAKGAVLAAKWLLDKNHGLYNMQDVIGN